MTRALPLSFILVLTMTANLLFGQVGLKKGDDPAALIEKVKEFSENTRTISSDFSQEKEMSFMQETVVSSGRFYFEKEKKLRWEYTNPYSYIIIINGSRIRIIDEGKKKDFDAGSNRMFLEISEVMSGMVNGTLLGSDRFTSTWSEAPGFYQVEMVPVETVMKDYISKITLKLNKADFSVDELKMTEKTGDFTLIQFNQKKLNDDIPPEIFSLD